MYLVDVGFVVGSTFFFFTSDGYDNADSSNVFEKSYAFQTAFSHRAHVHTHCQQVQVLIMMEEKHLKSKFFMLFSPSTKTKLNEDSSCNCKRLGGPIHLSMIKSMCIPEFVPITSPAGGTKWCSNLGTSLVPLFVCLCFASMSVQKGRVDPPDERNLTAYFRRMNNKIENARSSFCVCTMCRWR